MKIKSKFPTPTFPVAEICKSYSDYKKCCEQEITNRHISTQEKEVAVEHIRSIKEIIIEKLRNDHEKKKYGLDKISQIIDKALQEKDIKMIEMGLGAMLKITEPNTLQELIGQLQDPNNIIDI